MKNNHCPMNVCPTELLTDTQREKIPAILKNDGNGCCLLEFIGYLCFICKDVEKLVDEFRRMILDAEEEKTK